MAHSGSGQITLNANEPQSAVLCSGAACYSCGVGCYDCSGLGLRTVNCTFPTSTLMMFVDSTPIAANHSFLVIACCITTLSLAYHRMPSLACPPWHICLEVILSNDTKLISLPLVTAISAATPSLHSLLTFCCYCHRLKRCLSIVYLYSIASSNIRFLSHNQMASLPEQLFATSLQLHQAYTITAPHTAHSAIMQAS